MAGGDTSSSSAAVTAAGPPSLPNPQLETILCPQQPSSTLNQWSDLLKVKPLSAGSIDLEYQEPCFINGVLQVEDELLDSGEAEWKDAVVGYFLDSRLPFEVVKRQVERKWKLKSTLRMGLSEEIFYFRFGCDEDRATAMEIGSFTIRDKIFIIRPWTKEMEEGKGQVHRLPIWVRIYNIPTRLWNPKGIAKIASALGKPLFLDKKSETSDYLTFARVCIEIEPKKELPNEVPVRIGEGKSATVYFEYNWKPFLCTHCKTFGHSTEFCNKNSVEKRPKNRPAVSVQRSQINTVNRPNMQGNNWNQWRNKNHNKVAGKSTFVPKPTLAKENVQLQNYFSILDKGNQDEVVETVNVEDTSKAPIGSDKKANLDIDSSVDEVVNHQKTAEIMGTQPEQESSTVDMLQEDEEGEITETIGLQQCVGGVKLLSSSDEVPASLNGITEEVELVNKRMEQFLKDNAQSASLGTPSRTPKRLTAVSLASRKSQRDICAPERLDL